jgi:peptidyl-prolyl cis-trans isomerase A (cyclophilin A)
MQLSKLFSLSAALLLLSPAATYAQTAATGQREPGLYMMFQTEKGNISCKLFEKESPITVGKMVGLAIGKISYLDPRTKQPTQKKFFDGITFHRVIPGSGFSGDPPARGGGPVPLPVPE